MSEKVMLILTNANNNNNKFYEIEYNNITKNVTARYGRVGTSGCSTVVGSGESCFWSKIRSKENKGYKRIEVDIEKNTAITEKQNDILTSVVNNKLIDDKVTDKNDKKVILDLIDILFKQNRHAIESFSGGKIKLSDNGEIRTELGLISLNSVQEAQVLLKELQKCYKNKNNKFYENLNNYLMLVPQKVPSSRGWADYLVNENFISEQNSFLDLLEQTIKSNIKAINTIDSQETEKYKKEIENNIKFNFKISLLKDKKEFDRIQKFFENNKSSSHSSSNLKLKKVYVLSDNIDITERELTFKKLGNIQELWHGTDVGNVLSILKCGLIIPKQYSNGRLFGNGIYFSDNSTKSLNYSNGFWSGTNSKTCFMFLADVAMGKTYTKHIVHHNYPRYGYDSTFAEGKKEYERFGYLRNNEMIVYTLPQIDLKYLCEFE